MDSGSMRLSIVTGDSYTDEYEESVLVIYDRGRYVDRGSYLGIIGQLDAQLRDTNGTSARMKKQKLEAPPRESLRTPTCVLPLEISTGCLLAIFLSVVSQV